MKDSIKVSIIGVAIFLLMFGFCAGYLFRSVQVKAELKEQEREYLKIEENFYKSFGQEFNK